MYIRKSRNEDIPEMLHIYAQARQYMRETGNPNQWDESYPSEELLQKDMESGNSYVAVEGETIVATFAFIIGDDPTYAVIEDGRWLNEEVYGTIHRLAGRREYRGIARQCIDFCKTQIKTLRADTHQDNKIMQHLLEKNGFVRCGIIHLANGAPRIVYQYVLQNETHCTEGSVPKHNGEQADNGFCVASMVLGIVALVFFFALVNIPLAIAAIVFGVLGLIRKGTKGMAVAGIATATASMVLTVFAWIGLFVFFSRSVSANLTGSVGQTYGRDSSYSQDFYSGYYQGYKDGYYDGYYGGYDGNGNGIY